MPLDGVSSLCCFEYRYDGDDKLGGYLCWTISHRDSKWVVHDVLSIVHSGML